MLLFVNVICFDCFYVMVVLDVVIFFFIKVLVDSKELEGFLLLIRILECCIIIVDDEEFKMWKKVLFVFVERCRIWEYNFKMCEYVIVLGEKG